jgi:hypothetical protein
VYIDIIDMKNAETKGIVPTMIDDAAQAKIETYPLRRGIAGVTLKKKILCIRQASNIDPKTSFDHALL